MICRAIITLLAAGIVAPLAGAVTWERTTTDLHPDRSAGSAMTTFVMTNTGTTPVRIESIEKSCQCAVAELQRTVFSPGERAEILVSIDLLLQPGPHKQSLVVRTSDPLTPLTTLVVNLTVPAIVTITPESLSWSIGDPLLPKTLHVHAFDDLPLAITAATASDADLAITLREITPQHDYDLDMVPATTATAHAWSIQMTTTHPIPRRRLITLSAAVR
jgi:hypothetical protein